MLLPDHKFIKPSTIKEATEALAKGGAAAKIMSGGSDVIYNMRNRLFEPETLISISDVKELRGVERTKNGGLVIGTGERLCDLARHPLLMEMYPAIAKACRAVASLHVRNVGTLGGNLCLETRCWFTNQSAGWREAREDCFKTDGELCHVIKSSTHCVAVNNADTPPAFIAAGASARAISADGTRDIQLEQLYHDDGIEFMTLKHGEILTQITLPAPTGHMFFYKQTPRQGIDFAHGAIAGHIKNCGKAAGDITLVLASIASAPIVLKEAPAVAISGGLSDQAIDEAADTVRDEIGVMNNLFSPVSYKKDLARSLVVRALTSLREAAARG